MIQSKDFFIQFFSMPRNSFASARCWFFFAMKNNKKYQLWGKCITSFQQTNRARERKRINKNQNFLIGHTVATEHKSIMLVELIKIELGCLDKTKWETFKKILHNSSLKITQNFINKRFPCMIHMACMLLQKIKNITSQQPL